MYNRCKYIGIRLLLQQYIEILIFLKYIMHMNALIERLVRDGVEEAILVFCWIVYPKRVPSTETAMDE